MDENNMWQPPAPSQRSDLHSFTPMPLDAEFTASSSTAPAAKSGVGLSVVVATSLVVGTLSGFVGYQLADVIDSRVNLQSNISLVQSPADNSERPEGSIAALAAEVTPSVVAISVRSSAGSGTGSGFVIDSSGYILTNNHVIETAVSTGSITVDLPDGRTYDAQIVGRNSAYDLAVIKIDAENLTALALGNSDGLVVGDAVVAVGAPLGLAGTVTTGIVSALNRPVTAGGSGETSFINAVQTDAAINPGNSGGPLINTAGEVIGVNSAIATMSSGGQSGSIGLGFAIPINQAKRIAEEIIQTGSSTIPIIGVQLNMASSVKGAELVEITAEGPAALAGLKVGDVITGVGGRVVRDGTEFIVAVRSFAPGQKIELTLQSGKTVTVTLGASSTNS